MPADVNVFDKLRSFSDYQKAEEEFQLKKQLANAQLIGAQAQLAKAGEVDADKLGEQAFIKAAQGIPLTAQEGAALKYIDAKSPTSAFNPVTGVLEVKPSLLDRAGFGNRGSQPIQPMSAPRQTAPMSEENAAKMNDLYGDVPEAPEEPNEWDVSFKKELNAAAGNPKLQQSIKEAYAKAKISMSESESKNATFADRLSIADQRLNDPEVLAAANSPVQRALGSVPIVNKYLTSPEYQLYDAASEDYTTGRLRPESGATINPGEFVSDRKIAIPQPGDSPELLAQKAQARATVLKGVQRAAGPAYKPTNAAPVGKNNQQTQANVPKLGDTKTSPTGTYMFNGGDPSDKNNWKKVK